MLPAPGTIIVRACTLNKSHEDGDVPMRGNVSPIICAKDECEGVRGATTWEPPLLFAASRPITALRGVWEFTC